MSAVKDGSEITDMGDFQVEYRDASHRYWLIKDDERVPVTSPTGALSVLRQEWAIPWAEKLTAEDTLRLVRDGAMDGIVIEDAARAMRGYGYGPRAKRDAGADRGTAIHAALQAYCENGEIPSLSDYDESVQGYVQGLCTWLVEAKPEPILTEQIVASWEHKLAGRFDLLAMIDGDVVLVDLKTGARGTVYPEHHLQTAAYLQMLRVGNEVKPIPFPAISGLIVAVGEDASVQAKECVASWEDFLAVLECSRAMKRVKAAA